MSATKLHPESEKGELRRQQVLDAATECFRREGFHGSSIARISQTADMSPGHIYHYFVNKEAIVEAIAEREELDMAELIRRTEQDQESGDLVTRLIRRTPEAVERNSNPDNVGLMLETELRLRMSMVAVLFPNLAIRSLVEPERDRAATVRIVNEIIHFMFGAPR
ncbi:Transcriptional regulator, TetR family [plant metagenome]|uniref:Transcriptional regulator, TetR family n=1 Tax=plant metagenome TaxID=1297885 RepID=A0A484RR24_9ZZZZ